MVCLLLLSAVFGVALAQGDAAEPPGGGSDRDWRLACLARQCLAQDPRLAAQNLGISVKDQMATLWGRVASAELSTIAEQRLRSVEGVGGVHNELSLEPADAAPPSSPAIPPAPPHVRRPVAALTSDTPRRPADSDVDSLPSIAIPTPRSVTPSDGAGPPAGPQIEEPVSPADAVRRLGREPRFRDIEIEVRQGLVFLRAPAGHEDDLFALAQAAAELPGVERVIIQRPSPSIGR
jgi:hypothetical protein